MGRGRHANRWLVLTLALAPVLGLTLLGGTAGAAGTITGRDFTATAGTAFTGVIADTSGLCCEVSVDWGDGTPTETLPISPSDGTVTGTHTYATEGDFVVTVTFGGTLSGTAHAFVLSAEQGANLAGSGSTDVPAGGTGTVTVAGPDGSSLTATLLVPEVPCELFVATYTANPEPQPLALAGAFDVRVSGTTGPAASVQLTYQPTQAALEQLNGGSSVQLLFFDTATGSYQPVQAPVVVDPVTHLITITLDQLTTPSLGSLTMTVFAVVVVAATPVTPVTVAPTFTG